MKRNYTKVETQELIIDLSSRKREIADFATTALMMANPQRHLEEIIQSLETDNENVKQRIYFILSGFDDKRCVDALILGIENETNYTTKFAVIESIQCFHQSRIVPFLQKQLCNPLKEIRKLIITTLGIYVKHDVPDAHLPLLIVIKNETELMELRHEALQQLTHLDDSELLSLIEELKNISDASIYLQLLVLEDELKRDNQQKIQQVEELLNKLKSTDDVMEQIKLEKQIIEFGRIAAKLILDTIIDKYDDPRMLIHAMIITEHLGTKTIPAFRRLLESFDRFDDFDRILVLTNLFSSINDPQYKVLSSSFLKLLQNLNRYLKEKVLENRQSDINLFKSEIHTVLALYGCVEALDDLKALFGDGSRPQYFPLIAALKNIGDKDFLIPLINQYHIFRTVPYELQTIKRTFTAIARREKIKRNDPLFSHLTKKQQKCFQQLTASSKKK